MSHYCDGPIEGVVIRPLRRFDDARGWLIEIYREDELEPAAHPVMTCVSQTLPGVVRGPHGHREQTDSFAMGGPGEGGTGRRDSLRGGPELHVSHRLTANQGGNGDWLRRLAQARPARTA